MGRMARRTPEDPGVQTSMLWLLESYDATAVPLAGRSGLEAWAAREADAPLQAVAVLDRPAEPEPAAEPVPAPRMEDVEPIADPSPTPSLLVEQRLEHRIDCAMAVAAAAQSDTADTALGQTVDVSVSGVHLVMDRPGVVGPIELIVGDVVVGARVVDHRPLPDGRHAWHVHVLDTDGAWLELVGSALPADR